MIEGFENLTQGQFNICKKAVSWITVLIAGADGNIDEQETAWAKKIADIRSYSGPESLLHFYQEVGIDFSDELSNLINSLPQDPVQRKNILSDKLAQLNSILPLLDNKLAYRLYTSYTSFAKHVAKSSGGFLGFFSISSAESHLMHLPMVNEIVYHDEEE